MKSKSTKSWAALLQGVMNDREKLPPGEGWLTLIELSNELGIGENKTRSMLIHGVNSGSIERFDGWRVNKDGLLTRSTWYRIK